MVAGSRKLPGRTRRFAEREVDPLAIERDVRMHEITRRKSPFRQRSRVHRLARLVEDKNPAARTRRVTVDLGQLVTHRRRDVFHQQERADVEQRVLQDQGAANLVHFGPGPLPVQRLAQAGGRDPRLEGRPPLGQRPDRPSSGAGRRRAGRSAGFVYEPLRRMSAALLAIRSRPAFSSPTGSSRRPGSRAGSGNTRSAPTTRAAGLDRGKAVPPPRPSSKPAGPIAARSVPFGGNLDR